MIIKPRSPLAATAAGALLLLLIGSLASPPLQSWTRGNPGYAAALLVVLLGLLVWGVTGPSFKPLLTVQGRHFTWGVPAMQIQGRDPMVLDAEVQEAVQAALWYERSDVEPQWVLLDKDAHDTVYETDRAGTWKRELRGQPGANQRLVVKARANVPPPRCPTCKRLLARSANNCPHCNLPLPPRR